MIATELEQELVRLLDAYLKTRRRAKTSKLDGVAHAKRQAKCRVARVLSATPMAAMVREPRTSVML
jgi:ribosomal protein L29